MGMEIERKFLVPTEAWRAAVAGTTGRPIQQGYLVDHAALVEGYARSAIRIRRAGDEAWVTIKSGESGIARQEFEYPIPVADATAMLATLCLSQVSKVRYALPLPCGHTLEVDVFEGDNAGLVVAEVELASEDEAVDLPDWLGPEVSHLPRYFNLSLAEFPYTDWTAAERAAQDALPESAPRAPRS